LGFLFSCHQVAKTFDFAGEAVTVTKEVAADSREAEEFMAQQAKAQVTPHPSTPTRAYARPDALG
jgi:hypothetical protein